MPFDLAGTPFWDKSERFRPGIGQQQSCSPDCNDPSGQGKLRYVGGSPHGGRIESWTGISRSGCAAHLPGNCATRQILPKHRRGDRTEPPRPAGYVNIESLPQRYVVMNADADAVKGLIAEHSDRKRCPLNLALYLGPVFAAAYFYTESRAA